MLSNAAALLQLPQGIGAGSGDRAAPESPASLTHESSDVFNELDWSPGSSESFKSGLDSNEINVDPLELDIFL